MLDLCSQLRPKVLNDVYGQKFAVQFLKACIKNIESAPRVFLLSGPAGTGKTTLARAFQNTLAQSLNIYVDYQELDSTDEIMSSADYVRTLITSAVAGYRVVCIDECHKLSGSVQAELLKILEDNITDELFVFLCTNVPQDLTDALKSRLLNLELSSFSVDQCVAYINQVLPDLNLTLQPSTIQTIAISSMGCLRSCVKFIEMVLFEGESVYLTLYSSLWASLKNYFTDFSLDDTSVCQALYSYHPESLRQFISSYFREFILKTSGEFHSSPLNPKFHSDLFRAYLKLIGSLRHDSDFPSFLLVFRSTLRKVALASQSI